MEIKHLSQAASAIGDLDGRLRVVERKFSALAEDPQALKAETVKALQEPRPDTPEETEDPETPETPEETEDPPASKSTARKSTTAGKR